MLKETKNEWIRVNIKSLHKKYFPSMTLNQCDKAFKEMIFDEMLISPNYEFKNTDKAFKVKINKNIL